MPRNGTIRSPYGVEEWGAGYFRIGPSGRLLVCPCRDGRGVDLCEIVDRCASEGCSPPLMLHFPQILNTQLQALYNCFDRAMDEFGYEGHYRSVFPLKVNPSRPAVEGLIRAGRPGAFGLEVGSKGELAIALGQCMPRDSWICINGFKDRPLVAMATAAAGLDPKVVLVVERLREIPLVAQEAHRQQRCPVLGLRCRLNSRGSGRWEASGGETSKFGLGSAGLLRAVEMIEGEGLLSQLQVLHYHIGSQITSVRRIKDAVKEAARIYVELRHRGVPLRTLNVGGGLGIDYDGSRTPSDSSVNYTEEEFANNVIYTVQEVCRAEKVDLPDLVSESGRMLAAHHSLLITNCESRESDAPVDFLPRPATHQPKRSGDAGSNQDGFPPQLAEMAGIAEEISVKNFREYYHDAVVTRGEVLTLFDLGYLSLEQKATAEKHFYEICRRAIAFAKQTHFVSDEFRVLEKTFRTKYVTNFSVFRSAPDFWAVGHLFPVLPIHRLMEPTSEQGILVDLTCDSDGVIDTFVDAREVKEVLELHAENGHSPYLLAICLLGAYQEVLSNRHNLFGRPAQVAVSLVGERPRVEVIARGETIGDLVKQVGYDEKELRSGFDARLPRGGDHTERVSRYDDFWQGDPYLR